MWKRISCKTLDLICLTFVSGWPPAVALDVPDSPHTPTSNVQDTKSLLESILGDGLLWAVPKKRRSLEKRMSRRMAPQRIRAWSTPRRDIVSCLECGHWHLVHTICGEALFIVFVKL